MATMDTQQQTKNSDSLLTALEPALSVIIEKAVIRAFEQLKLAIDDQIDDAESLAKYLGCDPQTIHGLKNAGTIQWFQVGRSVRFRRQEVLQALSRRNSKGKNGMKNG